MQQRSEVKDRFKAVEIPAFEGGEQASVLVGHDVVVAKKAKNRDAALAFADFLTSPDIEAQLVSATGAASPLVATYEDPSISTPGIEVVRRALEQARPRPVTPALGGSLRGDLRERAWRADRRRHRAPGAAGRRPRHRARAGQIGSRA